ncbi:hypothetical protein V6N13_067573 [Hibiscus sabdariffa]|uniref:Uncharacterized protein n=1 Tax=Hibiscus sabdariffa TaxID=183260 RepID=A0ABR2DU90_9ROSI
MKRVHLRSNNGGEAGPHADKPVLCLLVSREKNTASFPKCKIQPPVKFQNQTTAVDLDLGRPVVDLERFNLGRPVVDLERGGADGGGGLVPSLAVGFG